MLALAPFLSHRTAPVYPHSNHARHVSTVASLGSTGLAGFDSARALNKQTQARESGDSLGLDSGYVARMTISRSTEPLTKVGGPLDITPDMAPVEKTGL